jgi:hypothetical protein
MLAEATNAHTMRNMDWRWEDHPLGLRLLVPRVPDDPLDIETARSRLGRDVTEPCEYAGSHYWSATRGRPRWWREAVPDGCLGELACAGMAAFITDQGFICDPHLAWLDEHTRASAYVLASAHDGHWHPALHLSPLQTT